MAARTISTLKFVGSISVGLLTGLSYTLSTLTLPTLLHLPSAPLASRAISSLTTSSTLQFRTLAGISSTSFFLAYLLSPRSQKHPYLLWTTLFISASAFTDFFLPAQRTTPIVAKQPQKEKKDRKGKGRQMDASFEVLSSAGTSDRDSEGTLSGGEDADLVEEVNGEEVRERMDGFVTAQVVRTAVAGVAFAMSVIGIWGDGAAELVVIESR